LVDNLSGQLLLSFVIQYNELRHLIEFRDRIAIVKDKRSVFYCPSCIFIAAVALSAIFEADATPSQEPQILSNLNFSSATTDAIDKTVRGMATDNIDKLMSETIFPVLTNSSRNIATGSNQTDGSTSNMVSNNQEQRNLQLQNGPGLANTGGSNNGSALFSMNSNRQLDSANNARAIADNGTILLQFQNPTDLDIVNRLDKIGTMMQDYTERNNVNNTDKLLDESNKQIMRELSVIRSSIGESSSSNLLYGTLSSAIVAGIVSVAAVFVFFRIYGNGGPKFGELKLWRRNNPNYH
jgi:hypothetical protein